MGNLLGENFPEFVKNQVDVRQEVYGRTSRTTQDLEYLNNKSAWIKLGSAVDIDPESKKYKDLGIPDGYGGNGLAKALVLFNGSSAEGNNNFKGIARDGSIINTSAYGFGGLDFGLVPMPGIKSVSTKYKNRGSLREATINLVAYNKKQFEIIELLYLRLGYTLLLEYGYDKYLNKGENEIELLDQKNSLMGRFLSRKYKTFYEALEDVKAERERKQGNYDGFVGRVKNFNWTFNKDGSYDITIVLVSMGDIIESLNINTLQTTPDDQEDINEELEDDSIDTEDLADLVKFSHEIGRAFYNAISSLKEKPIQTEDLVLHQESKYDFPNKKEKIKTATYKRHVFDREFNNTFYYVKFAKLFEFLQNNVVFSVNNGNTSVPSLKFDNNVQTNFMVARENMVSIDPRICMVDNSFNLQDIRKFLGIKFGTRSSVKRYFGDGHLSEGSEEYDKFLYKGIYGRTMNVFLEMGFILKQMEENKDENGKVSLFNFLKGICSNVNDALGNVCDLEPIIDEETNAVKIIDNNPLPNKEDLIKEFGLGKAPTSFEVYGYNPTNQTAGFVKEFGFKTEIDNSLATTITIGAQANGNVKGEDATAFTAWNVGLTDSLSPEKSSPIKTTTQPPYPNEKWEKRIKIANLKFTLKDLTKNLEKISKYYDDILENYGSKKQFTTSSGLYNAKKTDKLKDYQRSIKDLENKIFNTQTELNSLQNEKDIPRDISSSQIGFIPLNLSLTMDGLTGFKIYQKFLVSQRVLPPNYPDNLEFLIKGITHKVDSSGWETTLETQSIPKNVTLVDEEKIEKDNTVNPPPSDNGFVDGNWEKEEGTGPVIFSQSGRSITIEDLLSQLNTSSVVQDRFRNFFTEINTNYPGHKLLINSIYRSFGKQAQLKRDNSKNASAGTSVHNYGAGIDFNLVTPSGKVLKKAGPKGDWVGVEITDLATKNGLKWGGNFSNYVDCIHFYVDFNRTAALERAKSQYKVANINDPKQAEKIDGRKVNLNDLIT